MQDRRRVALLDHYPTPLVIAALAVLVLSLADAVLTLILVDHGAVELNPVMAVLLDSGPAYFVGVKTWLTGLAVLIILVLHQAPLRGLKIRVRSFLSVFTLLFGAAVVWQLYLITRFVL